MENLNKINENYEKENDNRTKGPESNIDLDRFNVESYLLNYTTDEQESLRSIVHEDKKKRLKQYLWIYEQEYRENLKLKELKEYNENFMKLPQSVNLFNFLLIFI